jgi:phage baseplate assembly protein W
MTTAIGVSSPLTVDSIDGHYKGLKTTKENISQNLRVLILTNPGERIRVPNFGVGIKKFLFEQANQQTRDAIRSRIAQQVATYMPYITLENISFTSIDSITDKNADNAVGISIAYSYALDYKRIVDLLSLTITI